MYYVVEGSGTFTLNRDEPQQVSAGSLIIIPPENMYASNGKMSLFEVDISRSNGFRDRLASLEPPVEPAGPTERQIEYQEKREQRVEMAKAVAQILRHGHTFIGKDAAHFAPYYGYAASGATQTVSGRGFSDLVAHFGAVLTSERYRGRQIFVNAALKPEDTYIDKSKASIDADLAKSLTARHQTLARNFAAADLPTNI